VNTRNTTTAPAHEDAPRAGEGVADFIPRLQAAAAAVDDAKQALRLHSRARNLLAIDAVDAGVSQRAVARALGVSQSRVIVLLGTDPDED
jgi:hypothetical protein